jgi:hypothetical protein
VKPSRHAIIADARHSPRLPFPILARVLFAVAAVAVYIFFGLYLLLGLIAINLVAAMLAPIARKRGWGSEGRLTRHLSRPPFEDPDRCAGKNSS